MAARRPSTACYCGSLCMNRRYQRESFENSLVRYSTGASPSSGPSASSPPSAQPETRRGALPGAYDLHGYGRCRSLLLGIANMDNVRCKHVAARDRGRHRDSSSVRGHSAAGRTAAHIGRVATTASMPWKPTTAQADCGLQLICRGRALVPIGRNDWTRQKPCRRRRRPPLVRGSVVVARGWSVGVGPGGRRRSIGLLSPTHLSWSLEMAKRRDARDVDGQSCDTRSRRPHWAMRGHPPPCMPETKARVEWCCIKPISAARHPHLGCPRPTQPASGGHPATRESVIRQWEAG